MNNKIILYLIGVFVLAFPLHVFGAGACCYTNGSCFINNDKYECSEGGTWQGDDTVCNPNPCPQPDTCDNANYCECYEIKWTDLDNPEDIQTEPVYEKLCFNFKDHCGKIYHACGGYDGWFSTFFDGLNKQAILHIRGPVYGFLKWHGHWLNVFTSVDWCEGVRYSAWGHVTDIDKCKEPI